MLFKKALATLVGVFMFAFATQSSAESGTSEILFTNVDVFDSRNAAVIEGANVRVAGKLIAEVTTEALSADGAVVIDGEGRMLIPGLIDGHNHITLAANPMALAYNMHWT